MKAAAPRLGGWMMWLTLNLLVGGYLAYALLAPASSIKTTLMPGKTTHGHHQIEMDCDACHAPAKSQSGKDTVGAVMQDACNQCHAEQLRLANDTHPASKFNDPTNADLLLKIDAQNCLTCHREHVPDQTLAMGLTTPRDYCWHCHQDVADSRPSHADLAYESCATAGCHNYHDNRALYEKFLDDHHGEPDVLPDARNPSRNLAVRWSRQHPLVSALQAADADAPDNLDTDSTSSITLQWSETAHAAAGVNCRGCHQHDSAEWSNDVSMGACGRCHKHQTESFLTGKHGMRVDRSLAPMEPSMARLPMHADAAHAQLTCNSCHPGHRFDTRFAAVDACLQCHADSHSTAYTDTAHAELWRRELAGELESGGGVSCATCHLPRLSEGDQVFVHHDQNANLRPNETMAREVCGNCHGLEFSLSSLADPDLVTGCFDSPPTERTQSVQMAHDWFVAREQARQQRRSSKPPRDEARKP